MGKIVMIATTLALAAGPALAGDNTPQTFSSGPGSAGSPQQQDMERSGMQSERNDQNQNDQNAKAPGNGAGQTYGQPTGTMGPGMNTQWQNGPRQTPGGNADQNQK
jgi:hypothetical protein